MPGNSFGKIFRITTFGESHGSAIGVIIDGVPAGLPLSEEDINFELQFRKPGSLYTSPRKEEDIAKILSGVFNGKTIGAPITIVVENRDVVSKHYEELKFTPRPNHADMAYISKYGFENWDYRGGGRASGRETVARVAAGAVAKKLLMLIGTQVAACVESMGEEVVSNSISFEDALASRCLTTRACKKEYDSRFRALLDHVIEEGDSVGAIVRVIGIGIPRGLGEPVFDKIKADLAKAMLSIPGAIGFEIGLGFKAALERGSKLMDELIVRNGEIHWKYNFYGGVLGGITIGEPLLFRVAFKPTSSIRKPMKTIDLRTLKEVEIVVRGRHDPCIGIRGAAVVEAMTAIVLVDHAMRAGLISTVRISQRDVEAINEGWERYKRNACLGRDINS
jgi:chorismate synthase|uniref:Chorismate synthase n=1 Tax=Ignisphaera aggregans TaxID=334771 RepID=A0A7J2U2K9_9CREN